MKRYAWVIDDHRLFNAGLSRLLTTLSGVDEVLSFANPQAAFDSKAEGKNVRIIISDYFMPGYKIDEWMPIMHEHYPNTPKVIISSSISSVDREKCLRLGAIAYFEKHLEPESVLLGLQQILDQCYEHKTGVISPAQQFAEQFSDYGLTPRQVEVLIRLARGLSYQSIALELGVSRETVKTHLSHLYGILNITSKSEAVDWARDHGLV